MWKEVGLRIDVLIILNVFLHFGFMKICLIIIILFVGTSTYCQISLSTKLLQADTVLLISHNMRSRSTNSIVDSSNKKIKLLELIVNDKLNENMVQERLVLSTKEIYSLSKILTYKYKTQRIGSISGCFDPHHSIIIMKNNKASFIDLCFHCLNYEKSKDIKDVEIRDDKMLKLYDFFKKLNFKYEMGR